MDVPDIAERIRVARFVGELPAATHYGEADHPVCGDRVRIALAIANGRIIEARWRADGCPAARAAADALCELLIGRSSAATPAAAELSALLPGLAATGRHGVQLALAALAAATTKERADV